MLTWGVRCSLIFRLPCDKKAEEDGTFSHIYIIVMIVSKLQVLSTMQESLKATCSFERSVLVGVYFTFMFTVHDMYVSCCAIWLGVNNSEPSSQYTTNYGVFIEFADCDYFFQWGVAVGLRGTSGSPWTNLSEFLATVDISRVWIQPNTKHILILSQKAWPLHACTA